VEPVIVVFTACQKINGTTEIVGIVFFEGPCTADGWGGGTINGSLVVEGDMAGMNANAELNYQASYVNNITEPSLGIQAKLPGAWIDS
jgi:hypothetical protein